MQLISKALILSQQIRELGCAVTFFTPDELGDVPIDSVEEAMIVAGNVFIQNEQWSSDDA